MAVDANANMVSAVSGQDSSGSGSEQAAGYRNPRRCSPEKSVSLRPQFKPRINSSQRFEERQSAPINFRAKPQLERSDSPSSASQWFKRTNENVEANDDGLLEDPPFYLDNHQNDSPSEYDGTHGHGWGSGRFASKDSEKSDLRDVIDDLTVENKQLRQRLKRYERANRPDLHRDKMFEVHVHGLSTGKKRDLEALLRDFVTKVNTNDRPSRKSSTTYSANGIGAFSNFPNSKGVLSIPADSAYASMSKSGETSKSHSGPASNSTSSQGRTDPRLSSKSRNSNVRSYLHNIPESLLPRRPLVMSERTKKKMVVQRLEYLFTGRSAAPGPHSQPMQQQEVSHSAAREGLAGVEGSREARIMDGDQKAELEHSPSRHKPISSEGSEHSPYHSDRQGNLGNKSPDQRPTRPLDLDIHRAQVPADNMEYIRHLGLPSPTRHNDESEDGWVYLNLLTNMAQLHTLNVTTDFVKQAVSDVSGMFQLSPDGRKVRWKGREEATRFSSDGGSNAEAFSGDSPHDSIASIATQDPSSNVADTGDLMSKQDSSSGVLSSRPVPSQSTSDRMPQIENSNPFKYKPMLFRAQPSMGESDDYQDYGSQAMSRLGFADTTVQSSSTNMAESQERHSSHNTPADAAIIFYKHAGFYTDLAGDRKAIHKSKSSLDGDHTHVLGVAPPNDLVADLDVHQPVPKSEVTPVRADDGTEDLPKLNLVPLSDATAMHQNFQEFPVSGLGGVIPDDNFLIDVKAKYTKPPNATSNQGSSNPPQSYAIVSAEKLELPPSRLPPPSYIFLSHTSSSCSELDFDSDLDGTENSVDEERCAPPGMLNQLSTNSYEADSDEDEDGDEDDDSSIDMLGEARAADPELIAAQEREYELSKQAQLFPDELPAGSSAATAGGGSGDASGVDSPLSTGSQLPSLKRSRSAVDSISVASRSQKIPRMQ